MKPRPPGWSKRPLLNKAGSPIRKRGRGGFSLPLAEGGGGETVRAGWISRRGAETPYPRDRATARESPYQIDSNLYFF